MKMQKMETKQLENLGPSLLRKLILRTMLINETHCLNAIKTRELKVFAKVNENKKHTTDVKD